MKAFVFFRCALLFVLHQQMAWSAPLEKIEDDRYKTVLSKGTKVELLTGEYVSFFSKDLPAPPMSDVQIVLTKLDQLVSDYSGGFAIPPSLKLNIWSEVGPKEKGIPGIQFSAPAAQYDYGRNEVTLGVLISGRKSLGPERSLHASVHEYGHVMLVHTLRQKVPAFTEFISDLEEYLKAADGLNLWQAWDPICRDVVTNPSRTLENLRPYLPHIKDLSAFVTKTCQEIALLQAKVKPWRTKNPDLEASLFEFHKYSELFADTLAVVDAGDLEVMASVTGDSSRSFSACTEGKKDPRDAHTFFSSSRCELGRLFLNSQKRGLSKVEFLTLVYNVIETHLRQSLQNQNGEYYFMPISADPDRLLIEDLNRVFKTL